jgi:hypothetical protein
MTRLRMVRDARTAVASSRTATTMFTSAVRGRKYQPLDR